MHDDKIPVASFRFIETALAAVAISTPPQAHKGGLHPSTRGARRSDQGGARHLFLRRPRARRYSSAFLFCPIHAPAPTATRRQPRPCPKDRAANARRPL